MKHVSIPLHFLQRVSLLLLISTLGATYSRAQSEDLPSVAILPFDRSSSVTVDQANKLYGEVEKAFVSCKRINVVERNRIGAIEQELDNQKKEASMNSDRLAAQGRVLGASMLVLGMVNTASSSEGTSFTLKAIDVETGRLLGAEVISLGGGSLIGGGAKVFTRAVTKSDNYADRTEKANLAGDAAVLLADGLRKIPKEVNEKFLKKYFPNRFRIAQITKEHKGEAEEMLILTDDTDNVKKGQELTVVERTILTVGDRSVKREAAIGKVRVLGLEGEVANCSVSKGGDAIKAKFEGKANVFVTDKKY